MPERFDVKRTLAYFMAGVSLILSAFAYQEWQFLGFPDGFLTEVNRAEKVLFGLFVGVSVLMSLWFVSLGWLASKRNVSRQLYTTLIFYSLIVVVVFGTDVYLRQRLGGGGGG
jgi:hypothetical protein